ncbi:hypothetical protein SADUNF_Sadunf02G0108400 [Salix dunnii]|uniref:Uncharacterized protein n=1 Tax=Salix dunnii TaxID=1413687 RepID=A0A835N761_9ROSI|nr:hypothetical protein SADUNF_Sadunf02G0108400 [Salix dunnii]
MGSEEGSAHWSVFEGLGIVGSSNPETAVPQRFSTRHHQPQPTWWVVNIRIESDDRVLFLVSVTQINSMDVSVYR